MSKSMQSGHSFIRGNKGPSRVTYAGDERKEGGRKEGRKEGPFGDQTTMERFFFFFPHNCPLYLCGEYKDLLTQYSLSFFGLLFPHLL